MRSRSILVSGMAALGLLVTACGSGAGETAETVVPNTADGLKVGMAYDVGGRGDRSFNDAAAAGMDKARSELGVSTTESTATAGEAESAQKATATDLGLRPLGRRPG